MRFSSYSLVSASIGLSSSTRSARRAFAIVEHGKLRRVLLFLFGVRQLKIAALRFQIVQQFAGALHHWTRQPGKLRDVDAIAAICAAGDHAVQEYDVVVFFRD